MKTILKNLLTSTHPGLYLLRVGLSKEAYAQTAEFSPKERKRLAKQIVEEMKDTPNIQKIIDELVRLEFSIESGRNRLRVGGRLAAEVLRTYISYHESHSFFHFYWDKVKREGVSVTEYAINPYIKTIWNIIKKAGEDVLPAEDKEDFIKHLGNLSLVFYEQLLPLPTYSQLMSGLLPIDLSSGRAYNEDFNQKLSTDIAPRAEAPQGFNIFDKLIAIKTLIINQSWEVNKFGFFVGGETFEGKRYPRRIKEILQLIKEAQLIYGTDPRATYEKILDLAEEALLKPGIGQKLSTKEAYQTIVNNRIMSLPNTAGQVEDFEFLRSPML